MGEEKKPKKTEEEQKIHQKPRRTNLMEDGEPLEQ